MFWWNIFTSMPDAYTPFMKMYDLIIFVFSTCLLVGQPQQQQHKDLNILAFTTCPLVDILEKVHICDALASTIVRSARKYISIQNTSKALILSKIYQKALILSQIHQKLKVHYQQMSGFVGNNEERKGAAEGHRRTLCNDGSELVGEWI